MVHVKSWCFGNRGYAPKRRRATLAAALHKRGNGRIADEALNADWGTLKRAEAPRSKDLHRCGQIEPVEGMVIGLKVSTAAQPFSS
jgi:hypothetical protein